MLNVEWTVFKWNQATQSVLQHNLCPHLPINTHSYSTLLHLYKANLKKQKQNHPIESNQSISCVHVGHIRERKKRLMSGRGTLQHDCIPMEKALVGMLLQPLSHTCQIRGTKCSRKYLFLKRSVSVD